MSVRKYFTYILTNQSRTVLYTGMTSDLAMRLVMHYAGSPRSFTSRYQVFYLIWFEEHRYVMNAIAREKEIKRCSRAAKDALIAEFNPTRQFLNEAVVGMWPPNEELIAFALAKTDDEQKR